MSRMPAYDGGFMTDGMYPPPIPVHQDMMYPPAVLPQVTPSGNILTFTPPGFSQSLNVKFPDGRLPVCDKCKKNYKTRDSCRVRSGHTSPPWTTAYICITLDESCITPDGKYVEGVPFKVRLGNWAPYKLKNDFDLRTPVCSACKKTNRTRSFCRDRHKHRQLPWCTVFVILYAEGGPGGMRAPVPGMMVPTIGTPPSIKNGTEDGTGEEEKNNATADAPAVEDDGTTKEGEAESKDDSKEVEEKEDDTKESSKDDKKPSDEEKKSSSSTPEDAATSKTEEKPAEEASTASLIKDEKSKASTSSKGESSDKNSAKNFAGEWWKDKGDDINQIDMNSRSFLVKISSKECTIHWLDREDSESAFLPTPTSGSSAGAAPGPADSADMKGMDDAMRMGGAMPPMMDPNQYYNQMNMWGQPGMQHHPQSYQFQQQQFAMHQQHLAAWNHYNQQMMQYGGNPPGGVPEEGGVGTEAIDAKNIKKDEDNKDGDDNKTHSPDKPSPQPTSEVQMSPGDSGFSNSNDPHALHAHMMYQQQMYQQQMFTAQQQYYMNQYHQQPYAGGPMGPEGSVPKGDEDKKGNDAGDDVKDGPVGNIDADGMADDKDEHRNKRQRREKDDKDFVEDLVNV